MKAEVYGGDDYFFRKDELEEVEDIKGYKYVLTQFANGVPIERLLTNNMWESVKEDDVLDKTATYRVTEPSIHIHKEAILAWLNEDDVFSTSVNDVLLKRVDCNCCSFNDDTKFFKSLEN